MSGEAAVRDPAGRGPGLRLELFPSFDAARDEWRALSERDGNVFASWEWASTCWRHFGGDRPLLLTVARAAAGRPIAIFPLYQAAERPVRVVRFVGHWVGDRHGLVCDPGDRRDASSAFHQALDEQLWPCDVLFGEKLSGGEWGPLLGGKLLRHENSAVVRREGRSWEEFLESRSANLRQQIRARERRLAREHDVRLRLADDPARLDRDLDTLFELHDARWRDEALGFINYPAFHREFAALALERGWLRLWLFEANGDPIAAWYGFRFGGSEWYYQAGRDPAWERYSVGFVLLAHTIREAFRDGVDRYMLGSGDQPYKARFATDDPGLETRGVAHGVAGRAALAAARGALRLPYGLRRFVVKLGG